MNFKAMTLMQKKQVYIRAKKAYYDGAPIITDAQFDRLEDLIREEAPKWSGFKTGAPVAGKKTKKKLPIPIGSLDKIKKPEQVDRFLGTCDEVVVSYKLDGAALELVYDGGTLTEVYTRGNGIIGGDVSFLGPHLKGAPQKVPTKKRVIIRAEGIFTKAGFAKYANDFDAARNAASGVLNRKDVHRAVKDLQIVAHQLLEPNPKPSEGLAWLKRAGFTVVPFKVFSTSDLEFNKLTKLLLKAKATSKYECDGLVVVRNQKNMLPRSGNPDWGVAFKETVEVEDAPTAEVLKVHWKVSAHAILVPRVELVPIKLSGATIRFAAAKNAKMLIANGIGPGALVKLVRSGDIIPDIVSVVKRVKAKLPDPSDHGDWHWDKNKVNIVLDDPTANADFRTQKIARTFDKLQIDFMRARSIQRLIDVGIDSVSKILKATPEDFLKVPGFKVATANKLHKAIHNRIDQGYTLAKLMDASSQFPRGIGETQLQSVVEKLNLMQLAELPPLQIAKQLKAIPGFGEVNAVKVAKGLPKFIKWLRITKIKVVKPKKVKISSLKLQGVSVSWTTYRSKDQEAIVEENGGQVVSFGVKKTNVLLFSPTGKASAKIAMAEQVGIPVMTWEQFAKKFKL